MLQDSAPSDGLPSPRLIPRPFPSWKRRVPLSTALALIAGLGIVGGLSSSNPTPVPRTLLGQTPPPPQAAPDIREPAAGRTAALEPEAVERLRQAFRDAAAEAASAEAVAASSTPFAQQQAAAATELQVQAQTEAPPQVQERAQAQEQVQAQQQALEPPRLALIVPLPVPRPPELRRPPGAEVSRRADRASARRMRSAAVPAPAEDTRSFFEKLLGLEKAPGPALSYAALESRPADVSPPKAISPFPGPVSGTGIAVYDIGARIVTLPNGERLEAHSGLAGSMDDPRYADLRMRGPTPPGTYDLTEREQLFHGVRALRLNPVGGAAAVYGRVGLLAHTFMLGPSGASNGCVSFRDYETFLQAFLRGEVQRLVVVAGRGQDAPPAMAGKSGAPIRSARLGGDT